MTKLPLYYIGCFKECCSERSGHIFLKDNKYCKDSSSEDMTGAQVKEVLSSRPIASLELEEADKEEGQI